MDYKKCNFCGKEADFEIEYDIDKKEYYKVYERHVCSRIECKNEVCKKFFGKSYEDAKKEYEHIGGKTEYLMITYNCKTEKELEDLNKSKKPKNPRNFKCTLDNYITRYGIDDRN